MIELPIYQKHREISIPEDIKPLLYGDAKILIAFSGGKDSVALVLYMLELGIAKERIELHHHEVDGRGVDLFDWACTPSYCQAFADAFELPLIFSWRQGGILREMNRENEGLQDVYYEENGAMDIFNEQGNLVHLPSKKGSSTRKKFPAVAADLRTRWCSSIAKIDVLSRLVNNRFKSGNLLILTGERREESKVRSKYKSHEKYRSWTKKRNAWQWRAVIDFTEKQVWELYEKYKVQPHPCYELGWSRCSCQTCIFSSPNTWASIHELSPEKIEMIAKEEKKIDHTLYHKITIWDKVGKGTSFIKSANLKRWKSEALGRFVSPIFVDKWVMPDGGFSPEASGSV